MKISKELRKLLGTYMLLHVRERYGNQQKAAAAWGISTTYVSKVCSGQKTPSDAMMQEAKIALTVVRV